MDDNLKCEKCGQAVAPCFQINEHYLCERDFIGWTNLFKLYIEQVKSTAIRDFLYETPP